MASTPVEVRGKMATGAEPGPPDVSQETQEGAVCGSVVPTVVPTHPFYRLILARPGYSSVFPMDG